MRHLILLFIIIPQLLGSQDRCIFIDSLLSEGDDYVDNPIDDRFNYLKDALSLAKECKDTIRTINALRSQVRTHGHLGNYRQAYSCLWEALLLADATNNLNQQFLLYRDLGRFYGFLKRPKKAEEFMTKALDILDRKTSGDIDFEKYRIFLSKISMNREFERYDQIEHLLDSCDYYLAKQEPNGNRKYYLEFERAVYFLKNGKLKEAINILKEDTKHFLEKDPGFLSVVNKFIGDAYFELSDFNSSETYYLEGIKVSEKYQRHVSFQPIIYESLSRLYRVQRKYEEQAGALAKYKEMDFLIFDSRSERNASLFDVHNDFDQFKIEQETIAKNFELDALVQNKKLMTLQSIFLLTILLFALVLGYGYFLTQRAKLKKQKQHSSMMEKEYKIKKELSEKLEKKNNELITYSHIMSHDLKAPLKTISGFSQLLRRNILEERDSDKNVKFLDFISNSAKSMSQLINDLLVYSKIDSGKFELNEVDLNNLLSDVLTSFQYSITQLNAEIEISALPLIKGNSKVLKTVFHNLISNALKYQPQDEEGHRVNVKIWSSEEAGGHSIFIKDNGIGIDDNYRENLFKPFKRFHSSAEYKGSGLGMSICKRIMDTHSGSIQLMESSDQGSTFVLRFPN